MEKVMIQVLCFSCPHARLVGGVPPNYRVQICCWARDNAEGPKRARTETPDIRNLEQCPDQARVARVLGNP